MFVCLDQDATDPGARIIVADEKRGVDLEWTVGGAFQVDSTQVMVVMVMMMMMVMVMVMVVMIVAMIMVMVMIMVIVLMMVMMMVIIIIHTSYQKLPFGSGDDPDKLFFHQALN